MDFSVCSPFIVGFDLVGPCPMGGKFFPSGVDLYLNGGSTECCIFVSLVSAPDFHLEIVRSVSMLHYLIHFVRYSFCKYCKNVCFLLGPQGRLDVCPTGPLFIKKSLLLLL